MSNVTLEQLKRALSVHMLSRSGQNERFYTRRRTGETFTPAYSTEGGAPSLDEETMLKGQAAGVTIIITRNAPSTSSLIGKATAFKFRVGQGTWWQYAHSTWDESVYKLAWASTYSSDVYYDLDRMVMDLNIDPTTIVPLEVSVAPEHVESRR